ncbi:MAG TPA: regulatory iron-sulfur-containing complex subunit RicT, partial [Gemmatimonadaceae bacterium]|nr:regulatory iron-sulfur-containing complex subunit RicT [Gemmatimonadaceae bacterium]
MRSASLSIVPHIVEVAFKGNRKELFVWDGEEPPPLRAAVVVEADRGEDLGHVRSTGELAQRRAGHLGLELGEQPRAVKRLATAEDLRRLKEVRAQDEPARRKVLERVRANGLPMKLTDAEWRWDRRKLTIYFTAERRVDFRALVRELAAIFRTRIELKQIGVRDEARRLSGIGRCGREYCSASWLPELRPVNLAVAKDQRLSLNPTQISGACGRLMCCLRFEHEFYVAQRRRFPKEGKPVTTARGTEIVLSNDIFRERVTLKGEDGEVRTVPLVQLRREMGVDRTLEVAPSEAEEMRLEELPEEVIRLQDTAELPVWLGGTQRVLPVVTFDPDSEAVEEQPSEPASGSVESADSLAA